MNEASFQIFYRVFPVAANILQAACMALFVRSFINQPRYRRIKSVIIFGTFMVCSLICDTAAVPQGILGLVLAVLLMAGSRNLGLDRAMAFVLILLYWNARVAAGLINDSVFFVLEQFFPPCSEPPELLYLRTAAMVTLFLLAHTALLAVMLYLLRRQLEKNPIPLRRLEICYISLIPAAGILFGQMIARLLFEQKDGVLLLLYERHPVFLAVVPLLAVLFFAGSCLTIMFQQEMTLLREENAGFLIKRQQIQAIHARIREAEQHYAYIRRLKHEMRGYLTNIRGLAQAGEYENLKEYISQIDGNLHDLKLEIQTGNPVTDITLSDIKEQCLRRNISFEPDFHYPKSQGYDAVDLGIILQNLLWNALEACEKMTADRRYITLTGRQKGRFFLIEVKNSFEGDILWDQAGNPSTTKKDNAVPHGIGLSNVRRETKKYTGELELSVNQQQFCATVMLQERSNYES